MVRFRRNRVFGGSYFFKIYPLNWGCADNDKFDQHHFGK